MARRAAKTTRASKGAKVPKGGPGKSRGKAKPADSDLEIIDDGDAAPAAGPGIEMGLVIVTLVALLGAFAMIYTEMQSSFGEGWPV